MPCLFVDTIWNSEFGSGICRVCYRKVSPSDNQIEIVLGTVTSDAVSFNITTTNSDPYAVFMKPSSNFKGKRDEEIIAYFKDQIARSRLERGETQGSYTQLIVVLNILFLHLDIKDSL